MLEINFRNSSWLIRRPCHRISFLLESFIPGLLFRSPNKFERDWISVRLTFLKSGMMYSNADYLDIQIFTKGNDKYLFSRITNCFNNPIYNIIVFNFNRVKKKRRKKEKISKSHLKEARYFLLPFHNEQPEAKLSFQS